MSSTPGASSANIESILHENRLFPPPADFAKRIGSACIGSLDEYRRVHAQSISHPEGFWSEHAKALDWFTPWNTVLEWNCPDAKWFIGGTTNICHNCIDRQVQAGLGDQPAIIWEGEPEIV